MRWFLLAVPTVKPLAAKRRASRLRLVSSSSTTRSAAERCDIVIGAGCPQGLSRDVR